MAILLKMTILSRLVGSISHSCFMGLMTDKESLSTATELHFASTSLRITSYQHNASGIVVIGKQHVDRSKFYSTLMVDELTFWNRQLSGEEVVAIRDMYLS